MESLRGLYRRVNHSVSRAFQNAWAVKNVSAGSSHKAWHATQIESLCEITDIFIQVPLPPDGKKKQLQEDGAKKEVD